MEPQEQRESNSPVTLAKIGSAVYLPAMLRKPLEIPPEVAKAFVRDMKKFFKTKDLAKREEIAASQTWLLQQHLPRSTKLRLNDVKQLFNQMRDQI